MLNWYSKLFVGEGARKNLSRTILKIKAGRLAAGIYVITLSANPDNLLEFFRADLLKQKAFRLNCPPIIGIAKGKDEAMDLVAQILQETYACAGTFCVEEYLKNR
ncbi:hypothetical protein B5F53_04785 [Blautia sp. An249]|uniref:hypothetical protein n=1 Tax=Blautia sp. An249 TaxID=1965603 RepID=UPI000B3AB129|nr:hypothetical protein [Blautia sp. An249]OUO80278.1 hypothetical protein B5F53_04785 [Blautia sp. An249]